MARNKVAARQCNKVQQMLGLRLIRNTVSLRKLSVKIADSGAGKGGQHLVTSVAYPTIVCLHVVINSKMISAIGLTTRVTPSACPYGLGPFSPIPSH
jgi:hypothetical protein